MAAAVFGSFLTVAYNDSVMMSGGWNFGRSKSVVFASEVGGLGRLGRVGAAIVCRLGAGLGSEGEVSEDGSSFTTWSGICIDLHFI